MLGDQPLPHPAGGVPLLTGDVLVATSHPSTSAPHGSIAGHGLDGYAARGGGTAAVNACGTVRRCTPCREAGSRIDKSFRRWSRRMPSNSSTRDRT